MVLSNQKLQIKSQKIQRTKETNAERQNKKIKEQIDIHSYKRQDNQVLQDITRQ
jgi:hypothetical protein